MGWLIDSHRGTKTPDLLSQPFRKLNGFMQRHQDAGALTNQYDGTKELAEMS